MAHARIIRRRRGDSRSAVDTSLGPMTDWLASLRWGPPKADGRVLALVKDISDVHQRLGRQGSTLPPIGASELGALFDIEATSINANTHRQRKKRQHATHRLQQRRCPDGKPDVKCKVCREIASYQAFKAAHAHTQACQVRRDLPFSEPGNHPLLTLLSGATTRSDQVSLALIKLLTAMKTLGTHTPPSVGAGAQLDVTFSLLAKWYGFHDCAIATSQRIELNDFRAWFLPIPARLHRELMGL